MRLPICFCLSIAVAAAVTQAELLQVQILHRHGARPHLRKTRADPANEVGGAELLPEGVLEMRGLGTAVRTRYLDKGVIAKSIQKYKSSADFYAVSSQTSRTLSSSRAFIQGLYHDGKNSTLSTALRIPTHVFASETRDWRLRGYTMCPAFFDNVKSLLRSDEFKKKEDEVQKAGDLKKAGEAIGEKNTDLSHSFNIYDRFVLATGGYANVEPEAKAVWFRNEAFKSAKSAADWMESHKYSAANTAGTVVSGGLLNYMVRRSNAMLGKEGSNDEKTRLLEYSGHYPLLLGAFAALGLDSAEFSASARADAKNASTTIPAFASALVWELHSEGVVKLFWVAGAGVRKFVPLPCSSKTGELSCSLTDISARISKGISSQESFCSQCGTDTVNSDVCGTGGSSKRLIGLGGFALGILVGALGACLYVAIVGRRSARREAQNATIRPLERNVFDGGSSGEMGSNASSIFAEPVNRK